MFLCAWQFRPNVRSLSFFQVDILYRMETVLGYSVVLLNNGASFPLARRVCYKSWEDALQAAHNCATIEAGRIDGRILSCLKASSKDDTNMYGSSCIYTIRSRNGTAEVYLLTIYEAACCKTDKH
jgi:hypothetical protein